MKKDERDRVDLTIDLGFGGLLKGLGDLIQNFATIEEKRETKIERRGEYPLGSRGKAMYGFTMNLGMGNKIEEFGNISREENKIMIKESRDPMVDLFEEEEEIRIIIEIPGVEREDIQIKVEDSLFLLKAARGDYKYKKEIILSRPVQKESVSSKYKNGLLTVTLPINRDEI